MWGLCSIYIGCAASRLATYNVEAMFPQKNHDSNYFSGLPSPGAAAAVCSTVLFLCNFVGEIKYLTYGLPLYAAILGLLMVSSIPYVHVGRWLQSVRRNRRRLVMMVLVLIVAVFYLDYTVIAVINLYIISGPVMCLLRRFGIIQGKPQPAVQEQSEQH